MSDPLPRHGIWSGTIGLATTPIAEEIRFAQEVEELGFGVLWVAEAFGREVFSHAALLLGATDRLMVATGIASVWARDPVAMRNGARTLAEAHPGRFVLGIGISHRPFVAPRGHAYDSALGTLERYVDGMKTAKWIGPEPEEGPLLLGALGPRMLAFAGDRLDGAHPYKVTPGHTRTARRILGPDRLLAPEQAVAISPDLVAARDAARRHLRVYLKLENYRRSFLRQGFDADDLEGDGSDRLVDAIIAVGPPDTAVARIEDHFEAGADHVAVQIVPIGDGGELAGVRALAEALHGRPS